MHLGDVAVRVDELGDHPVPVRVFGRPRRDIGDLEVRCHAMPSEPVRVDETVRDADNLRLAETLTPERLGERADLPTGCRRRSAADDGGHVEQPGTVVDSEVGVAAQRVHVHRSASLDEHLAVESGHPPLVLVLDVAVRAEA